MTAQISDYINYKNEEYSLVAIENEWPFNVKELGINPVGTSTGCYRGYFCKYVIDSKELILKDLYLAVEET